MWAPSTGFGSFLDDLAQKTKNLAQKTGIFVVDANGDTADAAKKPKVFIFCLACW